MRKLLTSAILISACAKAPVESRQPISQRSHISLPEPATEKPVAKPASTPKKPQPQVAESEVESELFTKPLTLQESLDALVSYGHFRIAEIIRLRVSQKKRKMKLMEEDGFRAANYLLETLPRMENARKLAEELPKATIELIRGIHERGVNPQDAEEIAEFLLRFLGQLNLRHPAKFDENLSHVIGRQWHEIDYSGEKMTWQRAKAAFAPKGVVDFRKAEYLEIYFRWESKQQFFIRIYQPQGRLPD